MNFQNNIYYDKCAVVEATKKLIQAGDEIDGKCTEGMKFDIVDVLRQGLSDLFTTLYHTDFLIAVENKDLNLVIETSIQMVEIIDDLDVLLGTRQEFLLGKWLEDAEKWAKNNQSDFKVFNITFKVHLFSFELFFSITD